MYRIIKVLNNNAILALDQEKKREIILLGNGIGFGKHPGEEIKMIQSAKIYTLVTKKKQTSALKVVNGIKPVYLEPQAEFWRKRRGHLRKSAMIPCFHWQTISPLRRNGQRRKCRFRIRSPRISKYYLRKNISRP